MSIPNNIQVVIQGENGSSRTEILPVLGPISVGRHPHSTLRLDSDLVSRQHVIIDVGHGGVRVEDVSTNGTIAGDILLRHEAREVPFGTAIVIGDFTVAFFAPQDTERPPSIAPVRMYGASNEASILQATGASRVLPPIKTGGASGSYPSPALGRAAGAQLGVAAKKTGALSAIPGALERAQRMPRSPSDETKRKDVEVRRKIHKMLLEYLDLATIDAKKLDDPSMRPKVLTALTTIVAKLDTEIGPHIERKGLIGELADEALGLGPLERFLADPSISEIMVVDPNTIYIEQGGKLTLSPYHFTDDERVRAVIERIVTPLGRRIDESSPLVDARLKDGSRVNAIIRPIALRGSCITIRKFAKVPLTMDNLVKSGSITQQMALFLQRSVFAKRNIVISGGTGSGKTTLLNILSANIPEDERIVTIEDAAELQLKQPHVVSLETRPPNLEGRGEYTIRDLVKNALRMRPDRIVVGECRGGEALDMLQAMNTGHDGSLTTTHANSPREALSRLETLVLMSGLELPVRAIREQIASSIHVIVQQSRISDGTRKVTAIAEVTGIDRDSGDIETRPIFEYIRTGTGEDGKVKGDFRATGYLPTYLNDFIVMGLVKKGEPYL
jgi:pilus assembly protein CpaF